MKPIAEKLQKILDSKALWIVISIVCAIIAWMVVMDTTNPNVEKTFSVRIDYENKNAPAGSGLTMVDDIGNVVAEIKVTGREKLLNKVSPADFKISVDFSEVEGPGMTDLSVSAPECEKMGVKIVDYSPRKLNVTYDEKIEIYLPIKTSYTDDIFKDGYKCILVSTEPATVPMSGFSGDLADLDYVSVDLSDQVTDGSVDGDKIIPLIGHFITKTGADVTANYPTERVTVKLSVGKTVPVVYTVTGEPGDDCYFEKADVNIGEVVVTATPDGSAQELASLKEINVGTVDISGKKAGFEKKVNLSELLGDHFEIVSESDEVVVSVIISRLETKKFTISLDSISKKGYNETLYDYEVSYDKSPLSGNNIIVTLKGKASDLSQITATSLRPTLEYPDMTGVYPGVAIDFAIPENITLVGEYVADVIVSEKIAEPEPTEDDNPDETDTPGDNETENPASTPEPSTPQPTEEP